MTFADLLPGDVVHDDLGCILLLLSSTLNTLTHVLTLRLLDLESGQTSLYYALRSRRIEGYLWLHVRAP